MDVKAVMSELMWRRRELIDTTINECLSGGVGKIEDMWLMTYVAWKTGDPKYLDYALETLKIMQYDREDIRVVATAIAREIERLRGNKEFYIEIEAKARREFYDLLAKCISERLPF